MFVLRIPRKGIARSQFLHSSVCERFIYSQNRSTYFLLPNRQTDREAPQFLFWEYLFQIFGHCVFALLLSSPFVFLLSVQQVKPLLLSASREGGGAEPFPMAEKLGLFRRCAFDPPDSNEACVELCRFIQSSWSHTYTWETMWHISVGRELWAMNSEGRRCFCPYTFFTYSSSLCPYTFFFTYSDPLLIQRLWRKNRRPPPPDSKCHGVDINRNFPLGYGLGRYL